MKLMLNGKEVSGMGHYVMAGDIKDATAEDSNVLSGKVYYNNNGKREGTMPNRGGMSAELAAGGSVSILEGYHNGEGVVRAQDLASQTAGTAAAANIEAGYTAWVNGEMVEGTAVIPSKIEDMMEVVQTITPTYGTTITPTSEDNYLLIKGYFIGDYILLPMKLLVQRTQGNLGVWFNYEGEYPQYKTFTLTPNSGRTAFTVSWSGSANLADHAIMYEVSLP